MARVAKKGKELTIDEKFELALVPETEQPYKIPDNWCWVRLGSVSTNQYGYTAKAIYNTDLPKMLRITDIRENGVDWMSVPNCCITEDDLEKYLLRDNDIVIARIGATTGKSFLLLNPSNAVFASYLIRLRFQESLIPLYVYYFLQTDTYWQQISELSSGIAQPGVNSNKLQAMMFPLAPLAEQQRIVDRIESLFAKLDEAKEKGQAVVDGYEDRKAAILHKAFTGELTKEYRINKGVGLDSWESVSLKDIVSEFKYGTSEKSDYSYTGTPVLRIPNIGDEGIDFTDIKNLSSKTHEAAYQIHENDILVIRSNGSRDLVGKCALVPKLDQEYSYASFLIRIKPSERVKAEYLVLFLNSVDARAQMFAKAKSSAGINNINSKELGAILMKLPELWEQEEISHQVSKLLLLERQAKETAEQVVDQIDAVKNSILARAFRGELGTNDPSDESAEELLKRIL